MDLFINIFAVIVLMLLGVVCLHLLGVFSFWVQNKVKDKQDDCPYVVYGSGYVVTVITLVGTVMGISRVLEWISLPLWYWSIIVVELGLVVGLVKLVNYRRRVMP